uniref:DNA-directed RNA polymerase subunit gamma n=1 Tax=Oedocladium carolinianum TaxID=55992 RepID=A0A8K1J9U3_9CHLO|nr:RNA polymerase beta' subunit [Oedocladium carolinianum]
MIFWFYFVGIILLKIEKVIKKTLFKNLSLSLLALSSNKLKNRFARKSHCFSKLNLARPLLMKNKRRLIPLKEEQSDLLNSYKFSEIQLITIDLASPEKIKEWAEKKLPNGKIFGQVTNPNTLHYKTLKPLKGGLFCERIFGPIKDFECACGIHKQKPFNRIISFQNKQFCAKCDIEYTWSDIRRYQLGYIELVTPITHLWYLKGMPSYIRSVLGAKKKHIEAIAYCSEIVTIDKAWKPNRLIPFPETISSFAFHSKIKKTIVNRNEISNFELISSALRHNFKQSNFHNLAKRYTFSNWGMNQNFLKKKNYKKVSSLKTNGEILNSIYIQLKEIDFNINFLKSTNFKETKCLTTNPYFYNIEKYSYKNKVHFYQNICRFFMKTRLKKKLPIYFLNFLYGSLSNSKISLKIFKNNPNFKVYRFASNFNLSLFNEEVLMRRFTNLYIFTKLTKYKQILSIIHSKNIYSNRNLINFKTQKLKNFELFNNSKFFTIISNSVSILAKRYTVYTSCKNIIKKDYFTFQIQLLKKNLIKYNCIDNLFLNNFFLFYLNRFSLCYFKNNAFFIHFFKLLTLNVVQFIKYDLFNIFILPIPIILDNLIFKCYLDSILIKNWELGLDGLNASSPIQTSQKILKKQFFSKNLSFYEEASEILWQKFWKVCYFFTYKKSIQKLRKIIKKIIIYKNTKLINCAFPLSLKIIKKIIIKIKINKKSNKNLLFEINIKNRNTNNKFSLFVNLIKIYLKKILFIYQISPEEIKNWERPNSMFIFQKFFKLFKDLSYFKSIFFTNKIKNIARKLFSLELLPWIFSQFILTENNFYKLDFSNLSFKDKSDYLKLNGIQRNLINKINKSSFCNFKNTIGITYVQSSEQLFKNYFNHYTFHYVPHCSLQQTFFIYKNQIEKILKYRKFRLFLNLWFFTFFKNNHIKKEGAQHFIINSKGNNINSKNLQNLNFLFYQKKWLLKKKQVFYNYSLLKRPLKGTSRSGILSEAVYLLKRDVSASLKYFSNFVKLIYSSVCKNEILINIFSIQIKQFYNLNFVQKIQKYFHSTPRNYTVYRPTQYSLNQVVNSNYDKVNLESKLPPGLAFQSGYFCINEGKKLDYIYSFILFYSKMNNKLFISLINLNNEQFFFNLLCFFKLAKKNIFNSLSLFKKTQTFFYSLKILNYLQKQQQKSILKFVRKKMLFNKFWRLIYSFLSYYKKHFKLIKDKSIIKLIKKKKMYICNFLKKLQIKLINEMQKYYFYEFEKKKFLQIHVNINNFKNIVIFMNLKKKKLYLNSVFTQPKNIDLNINKVALLNIMNQNLLNIYLKQFFYTSKFWQIIINIFKNRINRSWLFPSRFAEELIHLNTSLKDSFKIESLLNYSNAGLFSSAKRLGQLYFNSFLIKITFYNSSFHLINLLKKNKNKILQTRQQYCKILKSNNLFLISYFNKIWYNCTEFPKKNKKFENNFLFFICYSVSHWTRYHQAMKFKQNNYLVNFYLKFIKHDFNQNFNEAVFSVISESRTSSNYSIVWNNIYSLSNRYSWKSDIELNIFLCYMLSPENPSDILIPLYKKRIHSSNVLREEPPIAGGGIILKFLEELDLPEMKKIDIQLQTILKKIPNKLHEIEVLLKHYQTNLKFLKYYSIKRRTLIEIEKSILRKLKYIRRLNWVSAKPQFMIIKNLPVLPADLRPIFKIQQQLTASDLNRLYQKVMYRNDRLKRFLKNSTTSNSFEMLFAQRMLQEAVDNLIENGKDMNSIEVDTRGRPLKSLGELLKGKKGRFRQNLLGKRVDYSGRSVIVVGPKLKLHECGLPIEMAIELFLPFLIKEILKNKYALTVRSAKMYIKKHRIQITQLLRQIVKRQPILLNRAPTLHRLGIQAFLPKLVEGKAILLHPLVCSAFNADFDGDQMAVHVPITNEARIEAWKLVLSRNNLLSPATGEPILLPSQDMVLGCYYLTIQNLESLIKKTNNKKNLIFSHFENIFTAYQRNQIHLHTNIWVRFNNNIESDSIFQEPTEIQVQFNGQYTKIYYEYYQKFNKKGDMYNQVIRTTTGRILFNLMLNNCFN